MQQNRKFFGMSIAQLGVLVGLTVAACLIFGLAGWLFVRGGAGRLDRSPISTLAPRATSTMVVIPTLTPTRTPTPAPYESLIPEGWRQYKTALVEIWLPANFKTGDPKLLKEWTNLATPELIMTEATSKSSLYQMLVTVSYEPLASDSVAAFLDKKIAELPTTVHVAERKQVSVNSADALRFVFETRSNNIDIDVLSYVFVDGSTVWYVEYGAQINEFYEMLSTFETSVKTFRMVR